MVDTSGSMEASPQKSGWGITLSAAAYAVDVIPASASCELVTFSDKIRRESSDFENRNLVGTRVLDLAKKQPKGRTSLFDSIDQVRAESKELQFGDGIYVVTDGGDNKSRVSLPKLKEELIRREIRVFVFLVEREGRQSDEEISGASKVEELPNPPAELSCGFLWLKSRGAGGHNWTGWLRKSLVKSREYTA
jgi:uncharacterized protein with von Willebrand factor type A (vWA) domain